MWGAYQHVTSCNIFFIFAGYNIRFRKSGHVLRTTCFFCRKTWLLWHVQSITWILDFDSQVISAIIYIYVYYITPRLYILPIMSLLDHAWTMLTIYIYIFFFFLSCTPHSLGCFFLSVYALGSQWLQFTGLVAIRVREVVEERDYNRLQGARLLREFQNVPSWMVSNGSTWFHMVPRLASNVPGDFVFPPTPTNWWLCIFHFSRFKPITDREDHNCNLMMWSELRFSLVAYFPVLVF